MKFFLALIFLSLTGNINAQTSADDSLRAILSKQKGDSTEVDAISHLAMQQTQFDSVVKYVQRGLLLAEEIKYKKGTADCHLVFGNAHGARGNFSQAIEQLLSATDIYARIDDHVGIASARPDVTGDSTGMQENTERLCGMDCRVNGLPKPIK
jgi:hypothetical protein